MRSAPALRPAAAGLRPPSAAASAAALAGARDEHPDPPGLRDDRQRQRQARRRLGRCDHRQCDAGGGEGRGARKHGRRVAVGADTEQHDIENRRHAGEEAGHRSFVVARRRVRIRKIGRHRVDLLDRQRDVIEQRVLRHPVVAERMAVGHVALVAPERMNVRPRNAILELLSRGVRTVVRGVEPPDRTRDARERAAHCHAIRQRPTPRPRR